MKPRRNRHADQYEEQNREAAAVILADPERHGGAESLMVRWARLVVEQAREPEAVSLFKERPGGGA
jgi:hypothetical protein